MAENPFNNGTLFVNFFVAVAFPVKLIADASANAGGNGRFAAAMRPFAVVNRTGIGCLLRMKQGTPPPLPRMNNQTGAIDEGALEVHGQTGCTKGCIFLVKKTNGTTLGQWDSDETTSGVKILIGVKRIVSSVSRAKGRSFTQATFHLSHERKEVRRVAFVEGLGQFGQNEFAIARHFGSNDSGSIAPIQFADTDANTGSGRAFLGGGGVGISAVLALVTPPFAA